jgi:polar amino acid transport system substrate-binding protein
MEFFERPGDREPVGFDLDLATALARRCAANLRVISTDFTSLLPSLDARRCDFVMSGMFITSDRLARFNGVPYIPSAQVILVRAGTTGIAGPADLSGKVVSVQAGTVYERRLHALDAAFTGVDRPGITIEAYPSGADAVQQVITGRANAVITQDTDAAYRAATQKGQFAVAYGWPTTDKFGVYFPKNPADYRVIRAAIEALRADGTVAAIAEKWHLPPGHAPTPLQWPD